MIISPVSKISIDQASAAADILGQFLAQKNMIKLTPSPKKRSPEFVATLHEEARLIMQRIAHSAFRQAQPGNPESSDEKKRLNLISALRNFFNLLVTRKTSVYDPEIKEVNKAQRSLDHKQGSEKLKNAKISEIKNFKNQAGANKFDLITNQGIITLEFNQGLGKPYDPKAKNDFELLISKLGGSCMQVIPDESFKLQQRRYNYASARNITLGIFLKAFNFLQTNINKYKKVIGKNFEVFKTNVDLIVEGLQNATKLKS